MVNGLLVQIKDSYRLAEGAKKVPKPKKVKKMKKAKQVKKHKAKKAASKAKKPSKISKAKDFCAKTKLHGLPGDVLYHISNFSGSVVHVCAHMWHVLQERHVQYRVPHKRDLRQMMRSLCM